MTESWVRKSRVVLFAIAVFEYADPVQNSTPTADQVREVIFNRERRIFARRTSSTLLAKAFHFLSARKPVKAFILVEREAAETGSLLCCGNVLQAWLLDAAGLRSVEPSQADPGNLRGKYWEREVVEFFISDDNQTVIINQMEGPKHGTLLCAVPRTRQDRLDLKIKQTRVILNGHAMG